MLSISLQNTRIPYTTSPADFVEKEAETGSQQEGRPPKGRRVGRPYRFQEVKATRPAASSLLRRPGIWSSDAVSAFLYLSAVFVVFFTEIRVTNRSCFYFGLMVSKIKYDVGEVFGSSWCSFIDRVSLQSLAWKHKKRCHLKIVSDMTVT